LIRRKALTAEEAERISSEFEDELRRALEGSHDTSVPALSLDEILDITDDDPADWFDGESPETAVEVARLVDVIDRCNRVPEGHVVHPNLLRQLRRREAMVRGEQGLDWGCAEALAFGTLVQDGVPIRLSGQDSGRGTFSHRHAVVRDQRTEADHVPLAALALESGSGATFEVRDSLLSEEAALSYEYGYAVARPSTLVIWEAQFGDFVNGAQISVDQFLSAGEAKWKQIGGVTLLLPHGFDGQGPEHSSARPERFLGLCTAGNMTVCNCTTSVQYFHLMRRQGAATPKRPLVVLTPKSLLRDKRAASAIEDFGVGRFRELLSDPRSDTLDPSKVRRLLFCSGKVYYDLEEERASKGLEEVAIVRLEQLYPFPRRAFAAEIERFSAARAIWVQEEPRNMGAWPYILQAVADLGLSLEYAGRPASSSPATGSYTRHQAEQRYLVARALGTSS
jgi:2-oxoglutarate dehydrogenase E1 component